VVDILTAENRNLANLFVKVMMECLVIKRDESELTAHDREAITDILIEKFEAEAVYKGRNVDQALRIALDCLKMHGFYMEVADENWILTERGRELKRVSLEDTFFEADAQGKRRLKKTKFRPLMEHLLKFSKEIPG
jgi:phosphoribosylamine-glycine ligase